MKVGVFHPATQHSWQTALAFQESGDLGWYASSIFYDPTRWPYKVERCLPTPLREPLHREFRRRSHPFLNPRHVRQFGFYEWAETAATRMRYRTLAHWLNVKGNRQFGKDVIGLIQREPVDVVWGYDTSSLEVFQWAKKEGILCVLDQTIGHPSTYNRVMRTEQEIHPEFFARSFQPHSREWIERQNEEAALADLIVCGSSFCAETLVANGCPAEKIRVVPYGFDDKLFALPIERSLSPGKTLQFLFLGAITARKGAAYLLEAFRQIDPARARLKLVGLIDIPLMTYARYARRVEHVPQIARAEIGPHLLQADCFVFPSLFEGSAVVLYEACGAGLGILQSESAGYGACPGVNGIRWDQVSVEAIVQTVEFVLQNPDVLVRWQQASIDMRSQYTWNRYREEIRALVEHHITERDRDCTLI